jgi:hypothetical protein
MGNVEVMSATCKISRVLNKSSNRSALLSLGRERGTGGVSAWYALLNTLAQLESPCVTKPGSELHNRAEVARTEPANRQRLESSHIPTTYAHSTRFNCFLRVYDILDVGSEMMDIFLLDKLLVRHCRLGM